MKGRVLKRNLGDILMHAKCAAKYIRAQRDRLRDFQLQLRLQQTPGDAEPAPLVTEVVISGLIRVYCQGLETGAGYLFACLDMAAMNGEARSLPPDFAVIPDEQLFARLLALRLPRRPVTQAQTFARLEAAYYAVTLNRKYCLTRCIAHLGHPKFATIGESQQGGEKIGPVTADTDTKDLSAPDAAPTYTEPSQDGMPDAVTAAAEHLVKASLSDPVATATEDLAKIGLSEPDAAGTEQTPRGQAAVIDMDQARTYLEHACTLADLAVKHVDLAVTAISSCLDPAQVASISDFVDGYA